MNLIRNELAENSCLLDLNAGNLSSICHETQQALVMRDVLSADRLAEVEAELQATERVQAGVIGRAVAGPHVLNEAVRRQAVVFVRLARPLRLGEPDGVPTRFVFFLVRPSGQSNA